MSRRDRDKTLLLVDREVESQHRAGVDLAWLVVAGVGFVVAAMLFSFPDRVLSSIDRSGHVDFNGILALIMVVPIISAVFATRRYRDAVGAQRELAHLSDHDALTGLPNRRNLNLALPTALARGAHLNSTVGVLFVDLDGFKAVNDTYGHEVGDRLMAAVGSRLREICADTRWVARFGGDEFVVIDPTSISCEACLGFARSLLSRLSEPFDVDEDRITISASVGVALGGRGDDPDTLVKDADLAMYSAKRGTSGVELFSPDMRASLTPATVANRLERAIENGEFRLMYQPMVLLQTGTVVGVEALLRWDDPARGVVDAVDFLPALEATGLIVPVGRWVMNEVCSKARRWAELMPPGVPALRVSMNVSSRELAQTDFVDELQAALELSGVDPQTVYLEAGETSLTADSRKAWTALTGARNLGVGLALDDFGRGFISLGHLRNFDFNLLKLDGPFASMITDDGPEAIMVRNVIDLASELGIAVLVAGMTDEGVMSRLQSAGCQLGQGLAVSGPLNAATVDELIAGGLAGVVMAETGQRDSDQPTVDDPATRRTDVESATVVLPKLRRTIVEGAATAN